MISFFGIMVAACVTLTSSEQISSDAVGINSNDVATAVATTKAKAAPTSESTANLEPKPIPVVENPITKDSATAIDITKPLPVGVPQNGEALLISKACSGCHLIDAIGAGPSWKAENYANGVGIAQRAQERWQQSAYTGQATNATEYLVESILLPNAYVINGYMNGTMPTTFREILTDQELADIVAFLLEIE